MNQANDDDDICCATHFSAKTVILLLCSCAAVIFCAAILIVAGARMAGYALNAVQTSWLVALMLGLLSAVGVAGGVVLPVFSLIQIQSRLGEWQISCDEITFTPLIGRKKTIAWNDLQSHYIGSSFLLSGGGQKITVPLELIGSAKDDVKKALLRRCAG